MLSIGMFTYSTRPRGSVVHAASLAEALARAGHDVTLYALSKGGGSFHRPVNCRVELIAAGDAPAAGAALVRQRIDEFAAGLRARRVAHDVYHAQDCLAASALLEAGTPALRPIVRTVHHVDRFEDAYLASCQRRSILEADVVLSVSAATRTEIAAHFGRGAAVVPNGVDRKRFEALEARDELRARLGIRPADLCVLSVGGVEPRKNTRRCLAAVSRVHEANARIVWFLVGGDSFWEHAAYRAEFEADLARVPEALAARIVRPGSVSDGELTALYRASDVLLCPSLQEGFGLCVLEAMAAGTCVIVPGRPPFTEYLEERSAAFVDPESVDSIADALAALLLDPPRRAELAAAAANRLSPFSWERSARCHIERYENIGAEGPRGAESKVRWNHA
jgi:glycosyltransferase-like protein